MNAFRKILVGLDLSDTDYTLLEYTRFLGEIFPVRKAYFFHVSPGLEIPSGADSWYKDYLPEPVDEQIRSEMQEEVDRKIPDRLFEKEFQVVEGSVTRQLLNWTKIKQSDLVILGKKETHMGSGVSARRFLRNTECSVLFIPAKSTPRMNKLLVTTDFSPDSTLALNQAIELAASLNPLPEIDLLHVYHVPEGVNYQVGRTYGHFSDMIRDNISDYMEKYLGAIDTKGVNIHPVLTRNTLSNVPRHIYDYAKENHADMILIGARGHSALSNLLVGSVTEKTLSYDFDIPLFVVRPSVNAFGEEINMDNRKDLTTAI